jgi:hypothetical protein
MPCITLPEDPHGPCVPCRKTGHAETCGQRTFPKKKKKNALSADPDLRFPSATTWVSLDDTPLHAALPEQMTSRSAAPGASNMQQSKTIRPISQLKTHQMRQEANYGYFFLISC